MSTLGVRISDVLNERLTEVAKTTNRTKSQIAKMAIQAYLDEIEFYLEADKRYKDENDELIDYEQFKEDFNIN